MCHIFFWTKDYWKSWYERLEEDFKSQNKIVLDTTMKDILKKKDIMSVKNVNVSISEKEKSDFKIKKV